MKNYWIDTQLKPDNFTNNKKAIKLYLANCKSPNFSTKIHFHLMNEIESTFMAMAKALLTSLVQPPTRYAKFTSEHLLVQKEWSHRWRKNGDIDAMISKAWCSIRKFDPEKHITFNYFTTIMLRTYQSNQKFI